MVAACVVGLVLRSFTVTPDGTTAEGREQILNEALEEGTGWQIAEEWEQGAALIAGAYSADGMAALAVFQMQEDGDYQFQSSVQGGQDQVLVDRARIGDAWYDLAYFAGAATDYAVLTYTVDGKQVYVQFSTDERAIVCNESPSAEYGLQVSYYSQDGNIYE